MNYTQAYHLAQTALAALAPYCERIEIAGSLRRKKAEVHDAEIVCIPRYRKQVDLFGYETASINLLNNALAGKSFWQQTGFQFIKGGDKYKKIALHPDLHLDLFIVTPPAEWGYLFAIRTGPADFSHWLVTDKAAGGAKPAYLSCHDGAVWSGSEICPTPEEQDLFELFKLEWVEPEKRMARWSRSNV